MSSHLNRAGQTPNFDDACVTGSPIGYNAVGQIVVKCQNEAQSPLVQELLIWCVLTSAIFVLTKFFLKMRGR